MRMTRRLPGSRHPDSFYNTCQIVMAEHGGILRPDVVVKYTPQQLAVVPQPEHQLHGRRRQHRRRRKRRLRRRCRPQSRITNTASAVRSVLAGCSTAHAAARICRRTRVLRTAPLCRNAASVCGARGGGRRRGILLSATLLSAMLLSVLRSCNQVPAGLGHGASGGSGRRRRRSRLLLPGIAARRNFLKGGQAAGSRRLTRRSQHSLEVWQTCGRSTSCWNAPSFH